MRAVGPVSGPASGVISFWTSSFARWLRLRRGLATSVGSSLGWAGGAIRGAVLWVGGSLRVQRKLVMPGRADAGERLAGISVGDHHVEEVDRVLEVRVAAGDPGPRSGAPLLEL